MKQEEQSETTKLLSEYEQGVEDSIRIMWQRAIRIGGAIQASFTEEEIRKELNCI
jgi:hypothetical protein